MNVALLGTGDVHRCLSLLPTCRYEHTDGAEYDSPTTVTDNNDGNSPTTQSADVLYASRPFADTWHFQHVRDKRVAIFARCLDEGMLSGTSLAAQDSHVSNF